MGFGPPLSVTSPHIPKLYGLESSYSIAIQTNHGRNIFSFLFHSFGMPCSLNKITILSEECVRQYIFALTLGLLNWIWNIENLILCYLFVFSEMVLYKIVNVKTLL